MTPRDTLLIVDDMEVNRAILRGIFEDDFNLLEAENGAQAMTLLKQCHPTLAAMLLDLVMPVKDGYQVMRELRESDLLGEVPVVVITAEDSTENEVRAFDLGASDIIVKPFEPHVVKRRVQNIIDLNRHKLHLEELVSEQAAKLRDSNDVVIDALSSVIEYRSLESGQHILRIRMFTKVLLEDVWHSYPEYDLDEGKIALIASASAMHDIGKIAIPDNILCKPGKLTDAEYEVMKTHTVKGCEILAGLERMESREYQQYVLNICRYHHERWDGRGYPDGLKGDSIPICAQAVGIADAYDALTTDRVYKKAYAPERAFNMILNGECGAFSPKLLESLKNVREAFAQLSQSYADGRSPKTDVIKPRRAEPVHREDEMSTLQLGQMKYFALLRYLNATVVELDLKSGVYHAVYLSSPDFADLATGDSFAQALEGFVNQRVHPQDRPLLTALTRQYLEDFFVQGFMQRTWQCRIYSQALGEYRPYDVSLLRTDLEDPSQRKALWVWQESRFPSVQANREAAPGTQCLMQEMLGGVCTCLNDHWRTLTQASDALVRLSGYSPREMQAQFEGRYCLMVHPDDREALRRDTCRQLSHGGRAECQYRLLCKDGPVRWVLEKSRTMMGEDGQEYLCFLLIDITQSVNAQEQLRLTLERHQIILDQTNDIIFEWDIASGAITYTPNWLEKFGYEPITQSDKIAENSHLHPEDIPAFVAIMEGVRAGAPYKEAEVRLAKADGRYLWCRIRATAQFAGGKRPLKAVGVIVDIDRERRAAQEMAERAERDALTRLYNRTAAQSRVEDYLSHHAPCAQGALLVMDVDDFKQINDRRGHLFGDAVIAEIAEHIASLFRSGDVVARIGGDEFLIFMRDIAGSQIVHDRAGQIIAVLQDLLERDLAGTHLSCSIGIALCPADGTSYQQLFEHADQALYQAKAAGKGRYRLYSSELGEQDWPVAVQGAANTRIESDDEPDLAISRLVQQSFQELYESGDVKKAIGSILEMLGRQTHVSRAYIFENTPDGQSCRNTFEWCGEGIEPQIGLLAQVDYGDFGGLYQRNFNERGIFYCPDVDKLPPAQRDFLKAQGIESMLQCAIMDGSRYAGFVGFDDCQEHRLWTQGQIDVLSFVARIVSIFLLKHRAQERSQETAENLRTVFDHQNSWIYVIDPDDYGLLYLNEKTRQLCPHARQGLTCYKAFFDRDQPCQVCPARDIRRVGNRTMEIFNPIYRLWTLADATHVRWSGSDACLLACHDITKFKAPPQPL